MRQNHVFIRAGMVLTVVAGAVFARDAGAISRDLAMATPVASKAVTAAPTKSLVVVRGGMGTDGATLKPMPLANSAEQAANLYNALDIVPDVIGDIKIGVQVEDDFWGLVCRSPKQGVHTLTADCEYLTIVQEAAPKNGMSQEARGNVMLPPQISAQLYKALIVPETVRAGATTRTAGNLVCTRVTRPGVPIRCELQDVTVGKIAITEFEPELQKVIRKLAKDFGLND